MKMFIKLEVYYSSKISDYTINIVPEEGHQCGWNVEVSINY